MVAISFNPEFLDALLSGKKRQTTRPLPPDAPVAPVHPLRFKEGDVAQIYNHQQQRITNKPLRRLTVAGSRMIYERGYPLRPLIGPPVIEYYAHLLGTVEIAEVYDICPAKMTTPELEAWAMADYFERFAEARCWFEIRYGAMWMKRIWTVVQWDDWLERYFEPYEVIS